jgi:hypothetical protein
MWSPSPISTDQCRPAVLHTLPRHILLNPYMDDGASVPTAASNLGQGDLPLSLRGGAAAPHIDQRFNGIINLQNHGPLGTTLL